MPCQILDAILFVVIILAANTFDEDELAITFPAITLFVTSIPDIIKPFAIILPATMLPETERLLNNVPVIAATARALV